MRVEGGGGGGGEEEITNTYANNTKQIVTFFDYILKEEISQS